MHIVTESGSFVHAAMRVCNPDCSLFGIDGRDPAQAAAGLSWDCQRWSPSTSPDESCRFWSSHGNDNV